MAHKATINDILRMLESADRLEYGGEQVSQLQHALQCATLAENDNRPAALITACLLHDIGHLTESESYSADMRHEDRGAAYLADLFDKVVTEPIRLHVQAKRYLCYAEPGYWEALSPVSKRTLELQGGTFAPDAAAAFIAQPYAPDAVQLRRWDDGAKTPGLTTPDLAHFITIMKTITL